MRTQHHYGPTGAVWIRLVGPLQVRRGGVPVAATAVGNLKARALLALLAVRRGGAVTLDAIADALWEQAPPRDPAANIATLVSRLRASLGVEAVAGGRAGYLLGDAVGTDLDDAARFITRAWAALSAGMAATAAGYARQAVDLLDGGPLLADFPDAPWTRSTRTHHSALLRRSRLVAASAALDAGDVPAALEAAEAAAAADPIDESASRVLMRACVAGGEPARALIVYDELRTTLADELGVDPAASTRALHLAILRGAADPLWPPERRSRVG
jgi:DNA-binding SARP family transcriptional activator